MTARMFEGVCKTALRLTLALLIAGISTTTLFAQGNGVRTYRVTLTNLTSGQPMTPPVLATHHPKVGVFATGTAASFGVKEVAENGNVPALVSELEGVTDVSSVVVATEEGNPPPLLGGESVTVEISAAPRARVLSFVAMLICTNDGFAGLSSVSLPKQIGDNVTYMANSYDAGTEINTEDFADVVPPCAPLTEVPSDEAGAGESNPALDEGGVVQRHDGIIGMSDLSVAVHGWTDPVVEVVIERID